MTLKIKILLVGASALALTACGEGTIGGGWHKEAGYFIDEGGFGNPTMQNTLAQLCTGRAKGYIVPDPVVVLDPKSSSASPGYYRGFARCSGHLNGKYAQVIWREYVRSAVPPQQLEGGGLGAIAGAASGG